MEHRTVRVVALTLCLTLAILAPTWVSENAEWARAAAPGLASIYVDYSADCTFTLTVDPGTPVTASSGSGPTVQPGTYDVLTWMPNPNQGYVPCGTPTFLLTGPGVRATTVFRGQELHDEQIVVLQPGSTYVAVDQYAPAGTRHVFSTADSGAAVAGASPTSGGSGTSTQPDLIGSESVATQKLRCVVAVTGDVSLGSHGDLAAVGQVGRYTLTIVDRSPTRGLTLRSGKRTIQLSTARFVGVRTRAVSLTRGAWRLESGGGPIATIRVV